MNLQRTATEFNYPSRILRFASQASKNIINCNPSINTFIFSCISNKFNSESIHLVCFISFLIKQ